MRRRGVSNVCVCGGGGGGGGWVGGGCIAGGGGRGVHRGGGGGGVTCPLLAASIKYMYPLVSTCHPTISNSSQLLCGCNL